MAQANGAKRITIALGQFGALIGCGLAQTLREDPTSQVIAADLDITALETIAARQAPQVAVLDESAVLDPEVLTRLSLLERAGHAHLENSDARDDVVELAPDTEE